MRTRTEVLSDVYAEFISRHMPWLTFVSFRHAHKVFTAKFYRVTKYSKPYGYLFSQRFILFWYTKRLSMTEILISLSPVAVLAMAEKHLRSV